MKSLYRFARQDTASCDDRYVLCNNDIDAIDICNFLDYLDNVDDCWQYDHLSTRQIIAEILDYEARVYDYNELPIDAFCLDIPLSTQIGMYCELHDAVDVDYLRNTDDYIEYRDNKSSD
jgi:hypothetical protein